MNPADITVRPATPDEAAVVARLAIALTGEIMERTGVRHFNVTLDDTSRLCGHLMGSGSYVVLLASDGSSPLGFASLCESCALYADGMFGIIQEFYVVPAARSLGIGGKLLEAAADYSRTRGWKRLELCTPPLPEFQRSLAFYEDHGFEVTGGRKMKRLV